MFGSLRIAIIGAGEIARRAHLPGFGRAGAEVVALCSRRNPQLSAIAEEHGVPRSYYDWHELLSDGGFDAVSICTPPSLHHEMVQESARRGFHVYVEKPMALRGEECRSMTEACEKSGVTLMVGHNQRFVSHHQKARELVRSGVIGEVRMAHAVFGHSGPENWSPGTRWYFSEQEAGPGVLADLGSHKIDLLRWILGQDVSEIVGISDAFEKEGASNDAVACMLRFSRGTIATLHASWILRPSMENSLVLYGSSGIIRVPTDAEQPVRVATESESGENKTWAEYVDGNDPAGWMGATAAFVEAIRSGSTSPVPGSEGTAVIEAIQAASQSISQREFIRL